jgi:hypothetical protein
VAHPGEHPAREAARGERHSLLPRLGKEFRLGAANFSLKGFRAASQDERRPLGSDFHGREDSRTIEVKADADA